MYIPEKHTRPYIRQKPCLTFQYRLFPLDVKNGPTKQPNRNYFHNNVLYRLYTTPTQTERDTGNIDDDSNRKYWYYRQLPRGL